MSIWASTIVAVAACIIAVKCLFSAQNAEFAATLARLNMKELEARIAAIEYEQDEAATELADKRDGGGE
ncbi:MAG: hypothetical protein IMZ50_16505 [Candidatus Atribacteria bacterium]|nr:hypothetical protein [Candidatus Atribacteria bacterium]